MHFKAYSKNAVRPVQSRFRFRLRGTFAPRLPNTQCRPHRCGRGSRALSVQAAKKQQFGSFDEMVQESDIPVLVDFYATWCGPCQMLAPELKVVSSALKGRIRVVKIDTEKYPKIASRYSIQGLPTMVLFKNGKVVDRVEGFLNGQQILQRVSYMLGQAAQK